MTDSLEKARQFKEVLLELMPDSRVYLFGSNAKNQAREWSDIDLAVISTDIEDYWSDRIQLEMLAGKIDEQFEIHLFKPQDFDNPYDPLATEIKRYGILV